MSSADERGVSPTAETKEGDDVVVKSFMTTDSPGEEQARRLPAKAILAVFAVCMIYAGQLLTLVGAGAQGQTIAAHFNGTASVVWFSAPITIFTVVLGPVVSHAADYFGRRVFLVSLTGVGAVGAVVVSRATSINMAIAGFCVIGIAFGAQPLLHTVPSEVLPRRWRGYAQAAAMTSNSVGTIVGLLVGGALNRTSDPAAEGFRAYFLLNMAWFAVAALLTFFVYNPPRTELQKRYTLGQKLAKLDWVGYFLLAGGLVLFSYALSLSKNPYEWSNPQVSATFAVGMVLLLGLVAYETLLKKDGLFHHGLFESNRNFAIATFCVFSEGVAFFAANTYFAFEIATLYETDALIVGVRYSIMLIASASAATLTGWYCAWSRRVRWATVLAFLIFLAFFICMATTNRDTSLPAWGYPVLLGTALGMTLTTLVTAAQLSTPPELISIASGLIISVRSLGGTVGIAIYNALFNDKLARMGDNIAAEVVPLGLDPSHLGDFIGALSSHNPAALAAVPGVTPPIIEAGLGGLLNTFVSGFRVVWIAAGAFSVLAAVVACFLFDPTDQFNMTVDAPMDSKDDASDA